MGPRIPLGLKVFLAALAIVDDLGAVLVIALFYTAEMTCARCAWAPWSSLRWSLMNRLGVRRPGLYALLGVVLWGAFLASGVHATIAGVLLALTVPARTRIDTGEFLAEGARASWTTSTAAGAEGEDVLTNEGQQAAIQALEDGCEAAQAPLQRMEHALQPVGGLRHRPALRAGQRGACTCGVDLAGALAQPVTLGIILGLVFGKPIGITLLSWLAVRGGAGGAAGRGRAGASIHAVSWLGGHRLHHEPLRRRSRLRRGQRSAGGRQARDPGRLRRGGPGGLGAAAGGGRR